MNDPGSPSTGSASNCPDHSQAQLQKHLIQAFHSLKILKGRIFTSQEFTMRACMLRCVCLFATPWTVAHQAPLFMEFPGKSTVVGHHFLLQGIFLTQGSNLRLLHGKADSLPLSQLRSTRVYHKSSLRRSCWWQQITQLVAGVLMALEGCY